MRRIAMGVALALLTAAAAQAAPEDLTCRNGDFPNEQTSFGLAKVTGAGPLNFLGDDNGCPSAAPACRQKAYVLPGDVLLTGRTHGAFICAFFPNRVGGSAGWTEAARLTPVAVAAAPPLSAWVGRWTMGDDHIALKVKGEDLVAAGEAYWPSAHPSAADAPGGPNLGDLSGQARPQGATVVFADSDPQGCRATLRLVGDLLVAADNGACGGMNVSFTGVYRRK